MSDIESMLKRALDEHVDAVAGARRDPGTFVPSPAAPSRWRTWTPALVAAACIVALAITVAVVTHGSSSKRTPPVPPATHTVQLGPAIISLPDGWVARDYRRYDRTATGEQWCLTPRSRPVRTSANACPLVFAPIATTGAPVDVDEEGGFAGDPPQYCFPSSTASVSEQAEDRTLGGRPADWRRFAYNCANHTSRVIEQYVVATVPAYRLVSTNATSAVGAAMPEVARNSKLPAQTRSLRLMDRGYVRSVTQSATGVRISLDRAIRIRGKAAPQNPTATTYDYSVPASVWASAGRPATGTLVTVQTNGTTVTQLG